MLKLVTLFLVFSHTFTFSSSLQEVNQKLLGQKRELDSLMSKITVGSSRLQELEIQQDSLKDKIAASKRELWLIKQKSQELNEKIKAVKVSISKGKSRVKSSKVKLKKYEISFYDRLKYVYTNRNQPFLSMLFSFKNIAEFDRRIHYYNQIIQTDSGQFQQLKNEKKKMSTDLITLTKNEASLVTLEKELFQLKSGYLEKLKTNTKFLADIQKEQTLLIERGQKLNKSTKFIKDKIQNLVSAKEQIQGDQPSEFPSQFLDKKSISRNSLKWPLSKPFKIVSKFGKVEEGSATIFNSGIDLESENVKNVYAVEDGQIFYKGRAAGDSATYGKVIMISHDPDGKYISLYGNLSSILVALNQKVKRGDKIANIKPQKSNGFTKNSRLRFDFRVNRQPKNPLLWLKR
ncbi:MAG: peptidoglycan DD-metalloendopeptidase family protein [Candidatus Cloacimonetes bacterium]|nr:peptidoglycan DD-metalloendopeptidase family protein [Candidatus Cloacimonadota bacterium]